MQQLPDLPKKTTLITAIIWLVVVLLFVVQRFIITDAQSRDTLVSIMVLLAIYLGVPTLLLCVIDWLTFVGGFLGITWLSKAIRYVVIMGVVYLVGDFVSFMIERRVPYLGIKMVLFVHLVLVVWWLYGACVNMVVKMVFTRLAHQAMVLPRWLSVLLVMAIAWLTYCALYAVLNWLPIFDWLF